MLTAPSLIYDSKRATLPISYLKAKQWRWGVGSREGWPSGYLPIKIVNTSSHFLQEYIWISIIFNITILYYNITFCIMTGFFNDHTNKNGLWVVIWSQYFYSRYSPYCIMTGMATPPPFPRTFINDIKDIQDLSVRISTILMIFFDWHVSMNKNL